MDNDTTWAVKILNHDDSSAIIREIRRLNISEKLRVKKFNNSTFVNVSEKNCTEVIKHLKRNTFDVTYEKVPVELFRKNYQTPHISLHVAVQNLLLKNKLDSALLSDVPKRWERHGDLIILPITAFASYMWTEPGIDTQLWTTVAKALQCNRIARRQKIHPDGYRTPKIELLLGQHGWVRHIDNKIIYEFDVTKCMFSAGNITEKLRIAAMNCRGETVVDLYAGIGYFTLPFLVHAGANHLHACEWNKEAAIALERNVNLNGVLSKCTIHFGDNRKVCPSNIAHRVNLGLLPSSRDGWEIACKALLRETGGFLHIHDNVTHTDAPRCKQKPNWMPWANQVAADIQSIFRKLYANTWTVFVQHINCVKSYAPHVFHLVVDLECRPL